MTTDDYEQPDRPTEAIYTAARQECAKYLQDWPDDDWVTLTQEWDLNIYLGDGWTLCATLYPVIGGHIETSIGYAVPLENLEAIQAPAPAAQ